MTEQKCKQVVTELWTLAKSRSPYIVALQGAFYESGSIYILMEYMDCGALSDALRVAGRVPEPILAKIAAQVLRGLVYLHEEARVIHRDLKPSNILLSKEGRVKLVDFGVSGRVLEGKADANKSFVGTVTYMSPERLQGSGHFFDSDLWSLGLSLFECAVGRYPYQDEGRGRTGVDFWNIRELVLSRPAPALPDSFSMEFRSFVSTCLRKEHQNRPSASEMLSHSWIRKFGHCEDLGDLRAWLEQVARDRKARRKREQRAAAQRLEELRGIPEGSLSQP
jgi:mitogen-activated protein kinase kinase 1